MNAVHFDRGLIAWELREPHWEWNTRPVESAVYESVDGSALGICRFFPRQLQTFDITLSVMGIGGVYVKPEYRGNGVATKLLTAVCEELKRRQIIAALLHAKDGRLYQRLGFVEIQPGLWVKPLLALDFYQLKDVHGSVTQSDRPWRVVPEGHF